MTPEPRQAPDALHQLLSLLPSSAPALSALDLRPCGSSEGSHWLGGAPWGQDPTQLQPQPQLPWPMLAFFSLGSSSPRRGAGIGRGAACLSLEPLQGLRHLTQLHLGSLSTGLPYAPPGPPVETSQVDEGDHRRSAPGSLAPCPAGSAEGRGKSPGLPMCDLR